MRPSGAVSDEILKLLQAGAVLRYYPIGSRDYPSGGWAVCRSRDPRTGFRWADGRAVRALLRRGVVRAKRGSYIHVLAEATGGEHC